MLVMSIDHDIEIGHAKAGGRWDDLTPGSGDWAALEKFLGDLGRSNAFCCTTVSNMLS